MPIDPNAHYTLTRNLRQKPVPDFDASDMQFGTKFFLYQFVATNRTCLIFVSVYGTGFLASAPISGTCLMGMRVS